MFCVLLRARQRNESVDLLTQRYCIILLLLGMKMTRVHRARQERRKMRRKEKSLTFRKVRKTRIMNATKVLKISNYCHIAAADIWRRHAESKYNLIPCVWAETRMRQALVRLQKQKLEEPQFPSINNRIHRIVNLTTSTRATYICTFFRAYPDAFPPKERVCRKKRAGMLCITLLTRHDSFDRVLASQVSESMLQNSKEAILSKLQNG